MIAYRLIATERIYKGDSFTMGYYMSKEKAEARAIEILNGDKAKCEVFFDYSVEEINIEE